MKKRIVFYLIMGLGIFMVFPSIAKASWAGCHMQVVGNNVVTEGDTFEIDLGSEIGNDSYSLFGAHYVLEYFHDEVEPIENSITPYYDWSIISSKVIDSDSLRTSTWEIDAKTNDKNKYVDEGTLDKAFNKLIKVKFRVKNNTNSNGTYIKIIPVSFDDQSWEHPGNNVSYKYRYEKGTSVKDEETCFEPTKVNIDIVKPDAYLDNILINNVEIKNFNKKTFSYDIETSSKEIDIKPIFADRFLISGDTGKKTLKEGKNTFKITVMGSDSDKKEYNLNVTYKKDIQEDINSLKTLTLTAGGVKTYTYDPDEYRDYISNKIILNVDKSVNTITIESTLFSKKSSYVDNFGNRTVNLKDGENEILLKVKAENGNINTYTIIVNKSDATKWLNIEKIHIEKNKSNKEYVLDIDPNVYEYTLRIDEEDSSLYIYCDLENYDSKYEVVGNNDLVDGSTINVVVSRNDNFGYGTAKYENTKVYVIHIKKDGSNNASVVKKDKKKKSNKIMIIIIIASSVVVIAGGVVGFILYKKKKAKKAKKLEEDTTKNKEVKEVEKEPEEETSEGTDNTTEKEL